jgi:glycosyltransferase involved in cell wall biosynthesis
MPDPADIRPPRVLQVVRPAVGGMKTHVLQLARGLSERGFECEIACPGDSEIVQPAMSAGFTVHPIPLVGPLHVLRDPECIWVLRDIIKERKPDLVHAHGFKAGLVTRPAARIGSCRRVVMTVHNLILYRRDIAAITKWRYRTVERWLSRWTRRYIAVSEALRAEMIDGFGIPARKVRVIYAGLDLTPFLAVAEVSTGDRLRARDRYGLPHEAVAFGLAARFATQKGMEALVTAAVPVLDRFPRSWFVLAGAGPTLEACKRIARDSGFSDRIVFPGFETDVPGLLSALDVYVSAAPAEGLGLATIEAMAAGLPVASWDTGGTPEVVEQGVTGLLADPKDPDGLTDAMMRLAREPDMRRSMGEAGAARAQPMFAEERMFELTAELYREIL